MRVAIVGAGPGGLMLARLLQMGSLDVSVFERDASATAGFSGGSLDMAADSGRKAIRAAGLETEFRRYARPDGDAYTISNHAGRITLRIPALRLASRRPEIDRAHLRDMLLSSLAPDTVQWGRQFVGLSDLTAMKRIRFNDGLTIDVDLVIGADGARSQVRSFVTDRAPQYSGVTLLQGDIAEPERDCPTIQHWVRGANFFALGGSIGVFVQPRSSGALTLYVSQKAAAGGGGLREVDLSSRGAVRTYARELLQDWHPAFVEAVEAAAPLFVKPLARTADDQSWPSRRNITLIGDAAHVMPPFGGEGANMALLDALVLSRELLGSRGDLAEALVRYEQEMFSRSGRAQRATNALQEVFHASDAADQLVRVFMGPLTFLAPVIPRAVSAMNALFPKRSTEH